jgi:hypothetical protein
MSRIAYGLTVVSLALISGACEKKPAPNLAPTAESLGSAAPKAATALPFVAEESTSSVKFLMDSPLEKIEGDAPGSLSGDLFVDPTDLKKSSGLLKIDLDKLTLYQQKRGSESEAYGERKKSDGQNKHARGWLELEPRDGEVTPEQAKANRYVEFKLDSLETDTPDVTKLEGAERKVNATVNGDFRLHGRKAKKSAKIELLFKYAGDTLESSQVKSVEPVPVDLDEFEVHPRDDTGKLMKTITEAISTNLKGKVSNVAPITFEFSVKPKS